MAISTTLLDAADLMDDTETILRECEARIVSRQAELRGTLSATLNYALDSAEQQEGASSALAVLDTIAAADVQPQDPSARQELEHALPQQAASLVASMRQLAETKAGEVMQHVQATMAETQETFDMALQEHRFTDAAHAVERLRYKLDEANTDEGGCLAQATAEIQQHVSTLEMTFHQQLTTAMWTYYVFLQTSDHTDWTQPLLTVSTALQQTDLWASAKVCRCVEALCQELATALLQFLVVPLMGCTYAVDLAASIHDDEANYTQYALLSAVAAAAMDAAPQAAADSTTAASPEESGTVTDAGASTDGHALGAADEGQACEAANGDSREAAAGAEAGAAANAASVFACLVELVRFLRAHVFCENDDILGTFMEGFWPHCTQHAAQAAGTVTDQADELQRTIEAAKHAERELQSEGALLEAGVAWGALSKAMSAQEGLVLQHIQGNTVMRIRDACRGADSWRERSAEHVVAVGPAGRPDGGRAGELAEGPHLVWVAAEAVVGIVGDAVAAVDDSSTDMHVVALCRTMQDAVAVFTALVLSTASPQQPLRRKLLHSNSVSHLAAALAAVPAMSPLTGAKRLQLLAGAHAAAAAAGAAAAAVEAATVCAQRAAAAAPLRTLPPLQALDGRNGAVVRKQVARAVSVMQHVSDTVALCCSPRARVELAAQLLENASGIATTAILALADISQTDCDELPDIFDRLWSDVATCVSSHLSHVCKPRAKTVSVAGAKAEAEGSRVFLEQCPQARKLQVLCEMLRMRMAEILEGWKAGKLRSAGFSAAEVQGLLRAIFQDNAFRRQCISEIGSSD